MYNDDGVLGNWAEPEDVNDEDADSQNDYVEEDADTDADYFTDYGYDPED